MPRLFRVLIALTILAASIGAWQWFSWRQETNRRIARQSQPAPPGALQGRAPDFSLETPAGEMVSLADLRGKVVLVNFWATWCPPCQEEMPDLDALHRKYAAAKDFLVLGVNVEEDAETVGQFLQQNALAFPVLLDHDGHVTAQLFGVRPLPTTFIVDRDGFMRDVWTGQIALEAMVARLERVW